MRQKRLERLKMNFKEEFENITPVRVSTFVIELIASGREEEVKNNFEVLFLKCDSMFKGSFIKNIRSIKGIETTIASNFEFIIENIQSREVASFISEFIEIKPIEESVIRNFNIVIEKCRDDYLVDLLNVTKQCKGIDEIVESKLEKIKQRIDGNSVVDFIIYMKEIGKENEVIEEFQYWYNKNNKKNLVKFVKTVKSFVGAEEKLKVSFNSILENCTSVNMYEIIDELISIIEKNEILDKLDIIINRLNSEQLCDIWKQVKDEEGAQQKLKDKFKWILENGSEKELIIAIDHLKEINIIQDIVRNDIVNIINRVKEDKKNLIWALLKNDNIALGVNEYFNTGLNLEDARKSFIDQIVLLDDTIKDTKTKQAIYSILREVMLHENVKIEEVDSYGTGDSTTVLKIGEFVWKFQDKRKTDKLIYDPRILQPIVRKAIYDYEDGIKKDKPSMYIEMSNIVDSKWYHELTEEETNEELYKIYKEMRDRDIVYVDIKANNVGRLLKDNRVNYKIGENELNVEDATIDMYGRNNNEIVLKKGELVIFDTDYIYTEKEYEEMKRLGEFSEENLLCNIFERRYKEEKSMELER